MYIERPSACINYEEFAEFLPLIHRHSVSFYSVEKTSEAPFWENRTSSEKQHLSNRGKKRLFQFLSGEMLIQLIIEDEVLAISNEIINSLERINFSVQ